MIVMGLDLSMRATGVCFITGDPPNEPSSYSTHLLSEPKEDDEAGSVRRLRSISDRVVDLFSKNTPDVVVIEAMAKDRKYQSGSIGEVHGAVKLRLFSDFGIVPLMPQSNTARSIVVGKISRKMPQVDDGKGGKKRKADYGMVQGKRGMRKATIKDVVAEKLLEKGLEFPNFDEMDAYVVAKFGYDSMCLDEIKTIDNSSGSV